MIAQVINDQYQPHRWLRRLGYCGQSHHHQQCQRWPLSEFGGQGLERIGFGVVQTQDMQPLEQGQGLIQLIVLTQQRV